LVGCKRAGLRAVGRDELAEPRLSYAAVQHSAVVARVGAELEQAGHQVLSEREILARERAEGKRIYSAERRRGRGFHRPDLVLAGERPEAVEVELTDKAARRLDDIVRSWRGAVGMKKFGCVRYLCSERAFPYVKRSVERTHAGGPIDVQLLRHGEGLRELARDWVSESARERSGLQPAGWDSAGAREAASGGWESGSHRWFFRAHGARRWLDEPLRAATAAPLRAGRLRADLLDTTDHGRRLARGLEEDPEFRAELEHQRREIVQIDSVVRQLDELREQAGMSKAELARAIGKAPSSLRRFFSADVNPELKTVAAVADVLGAEVRIVRSGKTAPKQPGDAERRRPNGVVR
jgi:DNA-binding XRE family transcriptional regulator